MAINGVINGQSYLLMVAGQYAMFGTTASVQVNTGTKNISCRETENWKKELLTTRDWSMDFEGKLGFTYNDGTTNSVHTGITTITFDQILTDTYTNQDRIYVSLVPFDDAGVVVGTPFWYGEAYIASISIDTPNEDNSMIALSFSGVGPLIQDTN